MNMQFLYVLSQLLLLAVLCTVLMGKFVKESARLRIIIVVLLVSGYFIPVNGLTIVQWLRSVVGDLSVLMLVMLINILVKRLFNFNLLNPASRQYLLWSIVIVGILFYPFALGLGFVDPYHFGYAPAVMGVSLMLMSMVCWFTGKRDLAVVLLLPLLAFNLQLLESSNLWDYVLDPILFAYALVQSVTYWWSNRLIQ